MRSLGLESIKNGDCSVGVDRFIFDIILPTLSPKAQLVFLRIYIQTLNGKPPWVRGKPDVITLSEFRRLTGIGSNRTIKRAISELLDQKLIIVTKSSGKMLYNVNSDEIWRQENELVP